MTCLHIFDQKFNHERGGLVDGAAASQQEGPWFQFQFFHSPQTCMSRLIGDGWIESTMFIYLHTIDK